MAKKFMLLLLGCIAIALFLGYEAKSLLEISVGREGGTIYSDAGFQPGSAGIAIKLPAVDKEGKGALAELQVRISDGNGELLFSLGEGSPLLNTETQNSLRTAMEVARQYSGTGISGKNIYYSISGNSELVSGRSAGAAAAVATIALLKGERLRQDTLITGAIEPDGRIAKVGRIQEKAAAARDGGYRRLLVPKGELPGEGGDAGIEIIEVESIRDAYELMRS